MNLKIQFSEGYETTKTGMKLKFCKKSNLYGTFNLFALPKENTNKVQYPDHVINLADALTWVYNNIHKYGGDTTKLAIIGHSAGAHFAALLATNQKWLFANHLNPLILRGVAPLDTEGFNLVSRIKRDSLEFR